MVAKPWHALTPEDVCSYWETDPERGLSTAAAEERLAHFGANQLEESRSSRPIQVFLRQFQDVMVLILLGAAAASVVLGEMIDALTIGAIVLINGFLGFVHEYRAERAVEALRALTAPEAKVMRDGRLRTLPATDVVPGDIIVLETGDRVPADARLLEAAALEVEESALTGESVPITKDPHSLVPPDADLGDRYTMVYQGTTVTRGRGRAVVVATGMQTQVGNLASLVQNVGDDETPLQRRLAELGRWLVLGCGIVCALVVVAGLYAGYAPYTMILAGISLAVAAIPEGLPAVVTILLGLGVQRMSRRHAVVRRLPAVETLGCTTIICSDKTGTLTENRMELRMVWLGDEGPPLPLERVRHDRRLRALLESAVLCSNATEQQGSPTEIGLLRGAAAMGLQIERIRRRHPRVREVPFDSRTKRMTVVYRSPTGWESHVKGAPEMVIPRATHWWDGFRPRPLDEQGRRAWLAAADAMADQALRVLAVARRKGQSSEDPQRLPDDRLDSNLMLLGLVGLMDPPRADAFSAIERCKRAGVRVVMVTGDHRRTAIAIAQELGLLTDPDAVLEGRQLDALSDRELERRLARVQVFARVAPEHKLRIVRLLRRQGHVVAMTGDGVNDAPAVKEADIGIAMGRSGTDVTRETADLVLLDDNFATIVAAIEEGRGIYANVRKFIRYLLASNTGEVLVMLAAVLTGLPLPLLPIHILFINLVTDGLPAVALGLEPSERHVMEQPPRRPDESIFAHGLGGRIFVWGLGIGAATLGLFLLTLRSGDLTLARTVALASLVIAQMFHVIDCRAERLGLTPVPWTANPSLYASIATTLAALVLIVHWPPLAKIFRTAPLTATHWLMVVLTAGAVFVLLRLRPLRTGLALFRPKFSLLR